MAERSGRLHRAGLCESGDPVTLYRIIEIREVRGEALIEADSYAEAQKRAQTYSDDEYDDFEWTPGKALRHEVHLAEIPEALWEEKARPGHTVAILGYENASYWPYERKVLYRHVGTHNIRAQAHPTLSAESIFLKRFREVTK